MNRLLMKSSVFRAISRNTSICPIKRTTIEPCRLALRQLRHTPIGAWARTLRMPTLTCTFNGDISAKCQHYSCKQALCICCRQLFISVQQLRTAFNKRGILGYAIHRTHFHALRRIVVTHAFRVCQRDGTPCEFARKSAHAKGEALSIRKLHDRQGGLSCKFSSCFLTAYPADGCKAQTDKRKRGGLRHTA